MDKRLISRILIAVLVFGLFVAVGAYEYRLGVAHGVAMSGKLPAGAPGLYPYPYWGFHPFGFVFPLLFFFLIFGVGRWFLWGGRFRGRGWNGDARGRFDEWHRQAHESMAKPSS